jgi:hypothetical protein
MRKMGKVSTGLGLPFCKMAVEAHGGHIAVESEVGRGTIFRFTIPVIASAKPSNSSTSVDRSPVPLEAWKLDSLVVERVGRYTGVRPFFEEGQNISTRPPLSNQPR